MKQTERKPSFFWQGLLVLAPVIALTAVAAIFVHRSTARIKEDARAQADVLVQQLAATLPRAAASELLSGFTARGQGWFQYEQSLALWPGGEEFTNSTSTRRWYEARIRDYTNYANAARPADYWPVEVSFSAAAELITPLDYPRVPSPAEWLNDLAPDLRQQWMLAQAMAETNGAGAERALAALLAANANRELRLNARLALASLRAQHTSPDAAKAALLDLLKHASGARTEAGIPIATVAFAQAWRATNELDAAMFDGLRQQVLETPSIFTPRFLADADRVVPPGSEAARALAALNECWMAQERLRTVAHAVQRAIVLTSPITTNMWLAAAGARWLIILNPSEYYSLTSATNGGLARTNRTVSARLYREDALRAVFNNAISGARLVVPGYFTIETRVENERVLPPGMDSSTQRQPGEALAEGTTNLGLMGLYRRADGSPEIPFEMLPSHPRVQFLVYLSDPAALLIQQRGRIAWMLGLIVAAAAAALIGLVSAHRAFHKQLRLAELKSNFVSSVSHELRAPIASVRLMAEGLERGNITDPAKQRDYFRFITQECRRLSGMIENVLDFARIDQGRKDYQFEPTDVAAVVAQSVKLMEPYAGDRGVLLNVNGLGKIGRHEPNADPPQPSPPGQSDDFIANIDGQAIQQAVLNLIDNAIKHSPSGGEVRVALESNGFSRSGRPAVLVSVSDDGPGIPKSEHERIFERFYRLGSELRRETAGVGIGLSIVKHVVDAHGGSIRVHSEPGRGSRFTIELPK